MREISVLIIEESPTHSRFLGEMIQIIGYRPSVLNSVQHLEVCLGIVQPSLIIVEASMYRSQKDRIDAACDRSENGLPILVIGDESEETNHVRGTEIGRLPRNVMPFQLKNLLDDYVRKIGAEENHEEPQLLGASEKMVKLRTLIRRLADSSVTVLIRGESGTGKDLVARCIHYYSTRRGKPFVKVNCAAIPETLIESELFGYEKGSFTGAVNEKPGKFELAREGTLLLDEIGGLNPETQVKLLQVFQDKEFFRVGGIRTTSMDARLIAATNANLETMMAAGVFRADLYYRLNVTALEVPPLRERREDIPLLVDYFIQAGNPDGARPVEELKRETMEFFRVYQWPGNLRELRNTVQQIVLLGNEDEVVDILWKQAAKRGTGAVAALVKIYGNGKMTALDVGSPVPAMIPLKEIRRKEVEEAETDALLKALAFTGWNRKKAARILGVSYKSLLNKIIRYGLEERSRS